MTRTIALFVITAWIASAAPPARVSTLYDRVEARLAANPALAAALGQPSKELASMRWMIGRWSVTARVFATAKSPERIDRGEGTVSEILGGTWLQMQDSYNGSIDDLGFLTFDVVANRWIALGIDKTGNAIVATAEQWEGNRLALVAQDANIVGERVVLRQTIEKRSANEYRVLNEEQLADDSWAAIDEYVYTKRER